MPIEQKEYCFFTDRPEPLSYLIYTGFRCPRCEASVMQRKGTLDLGQGYDRVMVWSRHCLSYGVYEPPFNRPVPMTIAHRESAVEDDENSCNTVQNIMDCAFIARVETEVTYSIPNLHARRIARIVAAQLMSDFDMVFRDSSVIVTLPLLSAGGSSAERSARTQERPVG